MDGPDGSKLLLCLDGHGEAGDDVSGFLKLAFPKALFEHPEYGTNVEKAIADSIVTLERQLLGNPRIDTEFSGTTFVCGVIQGDQLIVGNVGDSRLTLGCAATPDAPLTALAVSIDHKARRRPTRREREDELHATAGRTERNSPDQPRPQPTGAVPHRSPDPLSMATTECGESPGSVSRKVTDVRTGAERIPA